MASHAQDDGFHEIQLNGKQLVFLFMAATVVSVVIFLCGVLVGRGVRAERGLPADVAAAESSPDLPTAQSVSPTTTPGESDPTKAAPPPEVDDLTYFKRLEQKTDPPESLPPSARESTAGSVRPPAPRDSGLAVSSPAAKAAPASQTKAAPASQTKNAPASQTKASPAAVSAAAASASEVPTQPPRPGFAVQVAALNARSEADVIARRLAGKGYAAYVLPPPNGTPAVFRVRVGTFQTRREAESVAAKLQKEEQFKPWITR